MKNKRFIWVMILDFLFIILTACGGGGGGTPANLTSNSSMVVTPSLGLINGADVKVTKPDGTQLGTTVKTNATGKATITFSGYSGPIIVEVTGNATATYFDEALGINAAFAVGEKLRAALDSVKAQAGVTPLTDIALQRAETIAGSTALLTATVIQTANESIRQALASEIADITAPPQLVSTSTTSGALDTSDASKYATKLAALAKLAKAVGGVTVVYPALSIAKQLAADLKDGVLDGKTNGGAAVTGTATYITANFASDLQTQITTCATNYGNTALQTLAAGGTLSTIVADLSKVPLSSIGGQITLNGAGLLGVTISFTGPGSAATTTDASGFYSSSKLVNGSYTVTPSLTGYTFTPFSSVVTVSNLGVYLIAPFVAMANTVPTYSISGAVSGAVLSGVTITLSGAGSATATTNSSGSYSFSGLANGSYTATPSMAGYTFTPASLPVTVSGANISSTNFVSTANTVPTYSIAGSVSGAVLSGVTITLSGGKSATATTSASGSYSFSSLANGSYTVTPSMAGYTFTPASLPVTISGANITSTNFVATANTVPTYSIAGSVSGAVLSGVTIILSGGKSATATTSASGSYSFSSLANGSYTVTPSMAGYTFTPASLPVTVSGVNITSTNFVAAANTVPLPTGYFPQGGLTWMPNALTIQGLSFPGANAYCTGTTINGQTGWRLPTQVELSDLYASGKMNPQGSIMDQLTWPWGLVNTWTSTSILGNTHNVVHLGNGNVTLFPDYAPSLVTCVR